MKASLGQSEGKPDESAAVSHDVSLGIDEELLGTTAMLICCKKRLFQKICTLINSSGLTYFHFGTNES